MNVGGRASPRKWALLSGLVAWGQAAKSHVEKILVLQKRVLRSMNFADFSSHAVPYFVSSKVLPINLLYYKLTSLLMLDVHNNSVPSTLSDIFTRTHQTHNYNTRSSSAGNYYIDYSRTNQYKNPLRESERKSAPPPPTPHRTERPPKSLLDRVFKEKWNLPHPYPSSSHEKARNKNLKSLHVKIVTTVLHRNTSHLNIC